jgi:phospholipid/cholesterol/gamma-HCH transport system substrate-binding protein
VIKNLEFKVGLLLALTLFLAIAFAVYALYARGAFERTQRVTLVADNAEGVSVGMKLTFSGFPIGQVERMTLSETGKVRIDMAVPVKDARWLRETSIFTLEKSLVGGVKLRAYSTSLTDPALPDGAERSLLVGDAMEQINGIIQRVKAILANIEHLTAPDSSISQSLANVKQVTERMAGEHGVLGGLLGRPEDARKVVDAIDQANTLLKSLNGVSLKVDGMLLKADQQVFGEAGVMPEAQLAVRQVNALLGDIRESLKKADAILREAQGAVTNVNAITADVKGATTDLASLRAEVDDSLRKVNHLINELNRKWPFARDVEIRLP